MPYTMYHAPYTIYHVPCTIYHIPYTIYHVPGTMYQIPYTIQHTLHTMCQILDTRHHILDAMYHTPLKVGGHLQGVAEGQTPHKIVNLLFIIRWCTIPTTRWTTTLSIKRLKPGPSNLNQKSFLEDFDNCW